MCRHRVIDAIPRTTLMLHSYSCARAYGTVTVGLRETEPAVAFSSFGSDNLSAGFTPGFESMTGITGIEYIGGARMEQ